MNFMEIVILFDANCIININSVITINRNEGLICHIDIIFICFSFVNYFGSNKIYFFYRFKSKACSYSIFFTDIICFYSVIFAIANYRNNFCLRFSVGFKRMRYHLTFYIVTIFRFANKGVRYSHSFVVTIYVWYDIMRLVFNSEYTTKTS